MGSAVAIKRQGMKEWGKSRKDSERDILCIRSSAEEMDNKRPAVHPGAVTGGLQAAIKPRK